MDCPKVDALFLLGRVAKIQESYFKDFHEYRQHGGKVRRWLFIILELKSQDVGCSSEDFQARGE